MKLVQAGGSAKVNSSGIIFFLFRKSGLSMVVSFSFAIITIPTSVIKGKLSMSFSPFQSKL
jgi:hypothetical protein